MNYKLLIQSKRILLVTAETVPSFAGGGRHAFSLAKFIAPNAKKTSVSVLNYNNRLKKREEISKVAIHRIAYYNKNFFWKLVSLPKMLWGFFKDICKHDIIFIYSKYLPGYQFCMLVSILLKKKLVFRPSLLGGDDMMSIKSSSRILWPLNRYLFKEIDMYFSINSAFSTSWEAAMKNNSVLFESLQGVDSKRFSPVSKEVKRALRIQNGYKPDQLIFLSCGVLLNKKGYRQLFEQLALLDDDFTYLIAGQYEDDFYHRSSKSELQEMQELLDLGKKLLGHKIKFLGSVEHLPELYGVADVFLHGAIKEGTPNVLLEAMSMGLPVVTRSIEGLLPVPLQHQQNALVFSDPEELTPSLKSMIESESLRNRLAQCARKSILELATFEIVAERMFTKLLQEE